MTPYTGTMSFTKVFELQYTAVHNVLQYTLIWYQKTSQEKLGYPMKLDANCPTFLPHTLASHSHAVCIRGCHIRHVRSTTVLQMASGAVSVQQHCDGIWYPDTLRSTMPDVTGTAVPLISYCSTSPSGLASQTRIEFQSSLIPIKRTPRSSSSLRHQYPPL